MGSYNRKSRDLRWETADQGGKRDRGLTGSHVIEETTDQVEKAIVGSQTAGETRAQSPKSKWGNGGDPWSENTENKKKTQKKIKYLLLNKVS